jgi:hypothetical protein
MFAAERWADAFIKACEGVFESPDKGTGGVLMEAAVTDVDIVIRECQAGLEVIKLAFHSLSHLRIPVSGSAAAAQFNIFLGAAMQKCGYKGGENGIEAARAVIFLLIQRNYFQYAGLLIDEIEDLLLKKQNILTVLLDCAEKPDDSFLENIKNTLKKRKNVHDVRITVVIMPELIGGYRINIGGVREDFSVLGRITQMEKTLSGASLL